MALLGFEALGKLALGQLPEGPLPFNQIDWSVPARIIPRTAPDQTHLNIELFTNPIPFAQYDWSKPCKPPAAKEQPNWSLNLELYKNPIPFGPYDYNKSRWTPTLKEQPNWALNLQLYKNLIPFGPYDYNRVKKSLPVIPDQQLRNIALLSVVTANPFFTQDFSSGHLTPDWLPPLQYPNLVLSNPIPFGPYDYSEGPFVPKLAKPDQQALNTKLYTNPVPFGPYDYQKAIFPVFYRPDPTQQLNLPRSVGSPFIPIDYQKSIFPIFYRPDASQQLNLSQNVGAPLIPVDWSKPFNIPELVFIQYPNLILLQPTTANPFYLQDFSKPFVPTSTKYDQQSLNLQLYTNAIPFAQFDWPRPTSYVRLVPEQNNLPNIVLPIVFPFYTRDWSNTKFLPSVPSPYMALNINSFTNPVPFNQYDWTKLYNIKPIISDLDNLPNL